MDDPRWKEPVDLCQDDFMTNAQATDAFKLAARVGTNPPIPVGFSGVGTLTQVREDRMSVVFSNASLGTIEVVWPRMMEAFWTEYEGKDYTITRSKDWLVLRPVDVDLVSILHVGTGKTPPERLERPLPDLGPILTYQLQCSISKGVCDEKAIQLEVRLSEDDDDPRKSWSGWPGGKQNWNFTQWSTIRTGECPQKFASVIAGEGYLMLSQ
ncbi:hypothetical protein AKJ08_1123 [Vulgatibacter incomptus]|uniref:Uncharacterized protein n=1 Tax=Vulgatibacter incomptus TaxID=1391653 RepID=A0A0K1PBF8_9BACT|nr:hypothetical protein AKJ08_1123 [Vulgatibacter incomptus]